MHRTLPAVFALGLALSPLAAQPAAPARPNIVFITSDDQRWDALGAAGNPAVHTPALDRLAARGVYFRQATTHVSQCLPVRATLLTGLTAHQHGALSHQNQRPEAARPDAFENRPTVPGLLRAAGYRTLLVGKWHLGADPWLSGFSEVRTWLPAGGAEYRNPLLARGESRELAEVEGHTQQIFADDALGFLRGPAAREKPFFLWLAFTAPHVPLEPNSPESKKLYAGKSSAELLPPGFPRNVPTGDWRRYYEAVSDLDRQVGRVVAALEGAGLAESTVVVFLGDNGFMMGQRGIGKTLGEPGKVVPYEGSIRVPLILWSSGWKDLAGTSDLPASSLDVPVTLLELAGIRPPAAWPGRDLLGALRRDPRQGLEDAFSEWADEENQRFAAFRLVRTPRHKLIVWKDPAKPRELYDLSADPAEEVNLYDRPEARDVRRDLEARLRAWMERTQDPAREWPVSRSVRPTVGPAKMTARGGRRRSLRSPRNAGARRPPDRSCVASTAGPAGAGTAAAGLFRVSPRLRRVGSGLSPSLRPGAPPAHRARAAGPRRAAGRVAPAAAGEDLRGLGRWRRAPLGSPRAPLRRGRALEVMRYSQPTGGGSPALIEEMP